MYGKLNSYLLGNHLNHYLKMSVVHLQSWVMHAEHYLLTKTSAAFISQNRHRETK